MDDIPQPTRPNYAFFITEGYNKKGERFESCVSDDNTEDAFLRELFEEFLEARRRGHARFMVSNRDQENWSEFFY